MDRLDSMAMLREAVDRGSLSAAGRALRVPVPTLSRRISELEARLGTRLLIRTTRSLRLTDAGERYLAAARRILDGVEEAEHEAAGEFAAPKGKLVVTAPLHFGRLHVLPVVIEFLAVFPAIDVRLPLADRNVHLVDDHVDLAVRIGPLQDSTMVATRIGSMRTVTCASPDLLARTGTPSSPEDLRDVPVVTADVPMPGAGWWFRRPDAAVPIEIPVRPRLAVTTTEAAAQAAAAGVGMVQLLHYQVAEAVAAGTLRIVLDTFEPPAAPVHLVHAARGPLPLKLRRFLEFGVRGRASTFFVGSRCACASDLQADTVEIELHHRHPPAAEFPEMHEAGALASAGGVAPVAEAHERRQRTRIEQTPDVADVVGDFLVDPFERAAAMAADVAHDQRADEAKVGGVYGARGDLADLLASDAALTTFCLDPAQAAATVGGLLALLPVERRRGLLAALAGRPDGDLIFAAARRLVSGGQERSAWHARRHLAGGIAAHGWIVGDHSYGTPTVIDGEFGHLEIGRYCAIAGDVRIIVANHAIDRVTTYPFAALHRIWPSAPADGSDHAGDGVVIGHDVWIGQGVTVLPGARIGDGAIVGAAAVIAGTVPPFSVVVGNPARVLRRRFDDETIRRLLAVGWWHWPDDKVDRFVPLLLGGDVGRFLELADASSRRPDVAGKLLSPPP